MQNKPLDEMTRDELRAIAKALEISGYTKLNKPDLLQAILTKYMQIKHEESLVVKHVNNVDRIDSYKRAYVGWPRRVLTPKQRKRVLKAHNRAIKRGEVIDALWTAGVVA